MVEGFLVGRYGNHHSWMIEIIMIRCQVLLWLYTFYFCFTVYLLCTSLVANLALSGGPDLGGWRESRQWQDGSRPARSRFPGNKIFISYSYEIQVRETVVDGFDKMPQALMGLFTGDNTGKMVVKAWMNVSIIQLEQSIYICDWWLNVHCTLQLL